MLRQECFELMFCVFSLIWMSNSEHKSFILFVLCCFSQIVSLPREKSVILYFSKIHRFLLCSSTKLGTRATKIGDKVPCSGGLPSHIEGQAARKHTRAARCP